MFVRLVPAFSILLLLAVPQAALGEPLGMGATQGEPLRDEIRARSSGPLEDLYAKSGYRPFWLDRDGLSPAGESFLALIRTSAADGFAPENFDIGELEVLANSAATLPPDALAAAELRFTEAFGRFVELVGEPRHALQYLEPGVQPRIPNVAEILSRAASAASPGDYIARMAWMSPHYYALRQAVMRFRQRWEGLPQVEVPRGPALSEGASGARVSSLRQRLGLAAGSAFDGELAEKLRAFQADHGLEADGVLGPRTIAALNSAPGDYLAQLRLNLERARVLPNADVRHIVVDAASARLWYYDEGRMQGSMRVIVGMPESPTPPVAGFVHYATLNPYWNVPVDLVQRNIAPAIARGAPLRNVYEVLSDWSADATVIEPSSVDWAAVAAGSQEVRVRELPGPGNAMGRVKFIFANELGIYLHDTPGRSLFDKSDRHLSNGCIRLEDAGQLLAWLSKGQFGFSDGDPEEHRALPSPVPVYVTYLTAAPEEGGIAFVPDVYRRDGSEEARLASR